MSNVANWRWMVLAAVLGAATLAILILRTTPRLPAGFPDPPELGSRNTALRALIDAADSEARRSPASADAVGRLGMIYHANQFYREAERLYEAAGRLDADDHRWSYRRALLLEETGRDAQVQDELAACIRLRPDYAPALQKLGDMYFKLGDLDAAARCYARSAAAGESPLQGTFGLGRIAARRKDWSRVVQLLEPLAGSHPNIRPVHQLLADAYDALGQAEKADLERRILQEPALVPVPPPEDPLAQELLGLSCSSTRLLKEAGLFSRFRRPDDAIRAARRAVEVQPEDPDARHFLARTLLEARGAEPESVTEALSHLAEGLRLRPDDPMPLWYFATVFFKQKKENSAVEKLHSMLAGRSGAAEAHYYLGLIADRQGRAGEAADHYRDALRRNPSHAEACHRLGLIKVSEGKVPDAIAWFRKAVSLKPDFTTARCNLGVALDMQGNTAQAVKEFRETLLRKPNDAVTHRFLAIALLRTGKAEEAVRHFRDAARFDAGDAEARYGLGCALMIQGRRNEAAEELKEALRLRPGYTEARDRLRELGVPGP